MSADRQQQGGGLSVQTLIVASLASMTAAVVIHEFWAYGAILGAAITPVIVALTSEALKKPIDRASRLAQERKERTNAGPATVASAPPAPDPRGQDPFGIWQAARPLPWYRRLEGRHVRLALVTGLVAFVIGGVALTAAELVTGGSLGSGGKRTTLVGGGDRDRDADRERGTEQPADPAATTPAPGTEQPAPEATPTPTQPAPDATQPAPTQPAPAPEPAQPGAPAPGGTPTPPAGQPPAG